MMRRVGSAWFAAAAAVAIAVGGGPARAVGVYVLQDLSQGEDDPDAPPDEATRARALEIFREGRARLVSRDYAAAAAEFRRSYEVAPSIEALHAEALAYDLAGDALAALRVYGEYLEFVDADAERQAEAERRSRALRALVGELTLEVANPAELRALRLDGEAVALADFPRLMLPGVVTLELEGAAPGQRRSIRVELRAGENSVVDFAGFPPPPVVVAPPPRAPQVTATAVTPPSPRDRSRALRISTWGGVAATSGAGVAVAILGAMTLRSRDAFVAGLCPPAEAGGCAAEATYPAAAEGRFERSKLATNVMIGATVGLAVVTLGLGLALRAERRRSSRVVWQDGPRWSF
jgi:hypothetical protein